MQDGDVAVYDADNQVQFFDVGNKIDGMPTAGGRIVNLLATVDGVTTTIGPFTEQLTTAPVGVVYAMNYRDKDHLWLFSELGSSMDSALYIDLPHATVERVYAGKEFLLSPSMDHVMYTHRLDRRHHALLVDSSTLLPVQLPAFGSQDDVIEPKTASGDDYNFTVIDMLPPGAERGYRFHAHGWASESVAYAIMEAEGGETTATVETEPVVSNVEIVLSWPSAAAPAGAEASPGVGVPTASIAPTTSSSQEIKDLFKSNRFFSRGDD